MHKCTLQGIYEKKKKGVLHDVHMQCSKTVLQINVLPYLRMQCVKSLSDECLWRLSIWTKINRYLPLLQHVYPQNPGRVTIFQVQLNEIVYC